ncbi:MAG TPA: hypothetical protein VK787_14115 [Puia sp.]|jgi:hypothetical protein|nr:hypothetical protein [Puia sp.]
MLITSEWSPARPVEPGKSIRILYSQFNFSVKIYNATGATFQKEIVEGKEIIIKASEIKHINPQQISFKASTSQEIHVHFEMY